MVLNEARATAKKTGMFWREGQVEGTQLVVAYPSDPADSGIQGNKL